jgi:hypothetical protein
VTTLSEAPHRPATPEPPAAALPRTLVRAGVAVAAIVGVLFYFLAQSDLWLDEALSVNIARLPLGQLHNALKHDGAPPLFYVLLHVWTAVFGTGTIAVRSLSGVCMIGAVVTIWFAARRWLGDRAAWLSVIVMLANPYAYRYATEARMYALVIWLVSAGVLAFQRALENPSVARVSVFAVIVALSLYTQYWCFYLLAAVVVLLLWMIRADRSAAAPRRLLVGVGAALVAFVPWLPTFLYQSQHTGTPWGHAMFPALPMAFTLHDFAGGVTIQPADEAEVLAILVLFVLFIGVFGDGSTRRRIDMDLTVPPVARSVAFVGGAGLAIATVVDYASGGAFQTRYSAIVFPFFVLLVARGLTLLSDPRIQGGVVAVVLAFGFAGGVLNATTDRTRAGDVATVLRHEARPGDVVVYCPDQLGPAVHRLTPKGLNEFTYPRFGNPAFVDWVDYTKTLSETNAKAFADEALNRAQGHTLWFVYSTTYITHQKVCSKLSNLFARDRQRVDRITEAQKLLEKPLLEQFAPGPKQ